MEIICDNKIKGSTAVALGNFDGLHTAHMMIINNCINQAKAKGLKSGVMLFSQHTRNTVGGGRTELITTHEDKLRILEKAGVDFVYVRDFDSEFMSLSPRQFVKMLKSAINPSVICVGYDYRFGYKRAGNIDTLRELGHEFGFDVVVTDEVTYNNIPIKSTAIRQYIKAGKMADANAMLGRTFELSGVVEKGLQNGRKIGSPTANVRTDDDLIIPQNGVYSGYTNLDGIRYKSVINIGNNPTFDGKRTTIESHILDFDRDIYGCRVTVGFIEKLRDDIKFSNIDQLKSQIKKDIKAVREKCI